MPRPAKSQWDFGELFPAAETRRVLTVAELTTQVKRLLEQHIGRVWVSGEITNLRRQASGHSYFTLKDAAAQLSCVLFRGEARAGRDLLEDGRHVLLEGELTVYEPRGQYQLRVTAVELQGVGALQLAFERLKQKLNAEGLFAPERKRPLPRYPQRLGLVTSPTGAALRDVLHVIGRRQPSLEIVLAPCRVQGEGAAAEIADAIARLNEYALGKPSPDGTAAAPLLDLILVTRGGGSLEDLWAFNEEVVARAIYASALPVVSAVGHEIDFTISDFVADLRAATPSAAAELITEGAFASRDFVAEAAGRLHQLAAQQLAWARTDFDALGQRLARAHPRGRLREQWQRLDDLQASLARAARQRVREAWVRHASLHSTWRRLRPAQQLARRGEALTQLGRRLRERMRSNWQERNQQLRAFNEQLRLLSPERVLGRGYSITRDAASGRVIRSAAETRPGQALTTRVADGEFPSVVEQARPR
jgi:exodeoxyribonuclease VII large subunit